MPSIVRTPIATHEGGGRRQIVIVGYGMAGARLADELRDRDPRGERVAITVLGAEQHLAYNRILLSGVLAGSMSPDNVQLHDDAWASRHDVDLRTGDAVVEIDRAARVVRLEGGAEVRYDALVLATGARPWIPPTEGLLADDGEFSEGVVPFRTLEDCASIVAQARAGAPVAVLGGGLLGLEAARALAGRGCRVTVVHPVGHLMERQLDAGAGGVLARALQEHGVEFKLNRLAAKYLPGDGLKLDDGGHVPADLVVVSAGVRAETGLAAAAGLDVDRGVVVDDSLRTSDPRIHAIGDVAQHPGTVSGLVQPAWEQATVLADLLTGADSAARYRGTTVVTRLKARGIDLSALGDVHADVHDAEDEVVCLTDPRRGRYAKLVLRDDKVHGAILLGVPDAAATVAHLYDNGTPAPSDRLALLLGRALPDEAEPAANPAAMPGAVTVCKCNNVSKSDLVDAWRGGARDAAGLCSATKAGTGCGGCADVVGGIAKWLADTA